MVPNDLILSARWKSASVAAFFVLILCVLIACDRPPADSETPTSSSDDSPSAAATTRMSETGTPAPRTTGQLLYVPCYSHIYFRDERRSLNLATTLSVRNTSRTDSLTINRVDYYDSEGARVRRYLSSSVQLAPLASTYYIVREEDLRGGVGANFLVHWTAEQPIDPPVVEAVHITTQSALGISFTSASRVLREEGG